jgi:Skp family chaperone for outer membrane proteins
MPALRRLAIAALAAVALSAPASAQDAPPLAGGVLLVDQDRLYSDSRFGQRIQAEIDTETRTLQAENRKLEADLEAEERALTARRATLPPDEFRALAEAFDVKVKGIRVARDAKAADLTARRETARKTFFEKAVPILAAIMRDQGALAIIDRSAVVIAFDRIDITDIAIARIDATLTPEGAIEPPPRRPETPAPGAAPAEAILPPVEPAPPPQGTATGN